ncbi:MAG: hypothetical protein ACUVQY_02195 [Thermoproteota archaeon]
MDLRFLIREIHFTAKRSISYILIMMLFSIMWVGSLYIYLPETPLNDVTPEAKAIIISNMVGMYLATFVPATAIFSIFPIMLLIKEEKNEKVFEHLFSSPSSPLKLVLYHFAAFIPFLILFFVTIYLLSFLAVSIAVPAIPSNLYSLIAWSFALSTIVGLPTCCLVLFNELVIPQKYSIPLPIFILPMTGIMGLVNLSSASQSTPFETFYLATIIVSVIITIADVMETFLMKDRIVEMTVTSQ